MAFKQVEELNAETTISLGGRNKKTNRDNPTSVEGYYLGKKTVPDKKKKSGESYLYILQTSKGNVGVWGKTDLDRKMNSVEMGCMIRVDATGTKPTPNGDMYTYKVQYDPDNRTDVGNYASTVSPSSNSEDQQEDTEQEDEEGWEEAPPVSVSAASKDRAARVQALLGKKK